MTNVVQLVPKNTEEKPDTVEEFLKGIAPGTDQIIFVRINDEGNMSIGHSPLAVKDLILVIHQLNRYIEILLESEGDMYVPEGYDE